jgi:Zinc dependent phospholipase C
VIKAAVVAVMIVSGLVAPQPAAAYSVLAHEANIDALWDSTIAPMLRARFPAASREQIQEARGYAYGGCVIQDLGYYPFGSHFFSNLLHYVRSGDFIEIMIRDAQDVDEYAFALGALGHYAADNDGHALAVNRAVALMYPKLKKQFGNRVTYAQSPKSHIMVEFSFDVVQVAAGGYAPEAYHSFIGFRVAKPLLERAFGETYGIEMKDIFFNEDLAIGTYRHAVATTIPEITKVAWGRKRDEIQKVIPGAKRETVVFNLRRQQYEKEFGADYAKPHGFARFLAFIYRLIPKIGPFRTLSFSVPTPEAERLFLDSFTTTREHFRQSLDALRAAHLDLVNADFDTGQPTKRGEYSLADDTYDELLGKLDDRAFANVSENLRSNLVAYYGNVDSLPAGTDAERKRSARVRQQLARLDAAKGP